MADRPILFSAPMVRALLAGTKTQTRRQIKPRGTRPSIFNGGWTDSYVLDPGNERWRQQDIRIAVGDRLWVKERAMRKPDIWHYFADDTQVDWPGREPLAHFKRDNCPSIHLPKKASRLTLTVTDVRIERLQDISETDARAEGVDPASVHPGWWKSQTDGKLCPTARDAYGDLWNGINGEGAWQANPWVVCYSFSVAKGNIDNLGDAK
jgi:hypothetical protein